MSGVTQQLESDDARRKWKGKLIGTGIVMSRDFYFCTRTPSEGPQMSSAQISLPHLISFNFSNEIFSLASMLMMMMMPMWWTIIVRDIWCTDAFWGHEFMYIIKEENQLFSSRSFPTEPRRNALLRRNCRSLSTNVCGGFWLWIRQKLNEN